MDIYTDTVTIFNYYESPTDGIATWYPHVIAGVDLNTDRGAIMKKYGADVSDTAQLHIRCTLDGEKRLVGNVPYLAPKEWLAQTNDSLAESIAFNPETDFFWAGEWTDGAVNDANYREGFYQYMNKRKEHVYKITSVGGPYSLIPHFEILGK